MSSPEFPRPHVIVLPEVGQDITDSFRHALARDDSFLSHAEQWVQEQQPDMVAFIEELIAGEELSTDGVQLVRETCAVVYALFDTRVRGHMPRIEPTTIGSVATEMLSQGRAAFSQEMFSVMEQAHPHVDDFMPDFILGRKGELHGTQQNDVLLAFDAFSVTYALVEGQAAKAVTPIFSPN
jgi:hypothetical protein